jgi:hypothetical protein
VYGMQARVFECGRGESQPLKKCTVYGAARVRHSSSGVRRAVSVGSWCRFLVLRRVRRLSTCSRCMNASCTLPFGMYHVVVYLSDLTSPRRNRLAYPVVARGIPGHGRHNGTRARASWRVALRARARCAARVSGSVSA